MPNSPEIRRKIRLEFLKNKRQEQTSSTALLGAAQILECNKSSSGVAAEVPSTSAQQEISVIDERARKLEARKQRNRESAEASRKRVRDHIENLENMNSILQDQVAFLKGRLALYEADAGENFPHKKQRPGITSNLGTSSVSQLSSLEPAAFIEQPLRTCILAGA